VIKNSLKYLRQVTCDMWPPQKETISELELLMLRWLVHLSDCIFYLLRLSNFCLLDFFHLCCATIYGGEIKLYIIVRHSCSTSLGKCASVDGWKPTGQGRRSYVFFWLRTHPLFEMNCLLLRLHPTWHWQKSNIIHWIMFQ